MKIMKKNILFGVVCVALLTATSCSDFLDVQPEGDARDNAYFLNDQQAIDAVDGLYERFHQEAMYGRELFWEQGAANDIVWGKTRDFPTLATFKYTGDESPLRTVFETMYKVISRSNWVIDQLVDKEKTTALTEIENRSLGEAYFTRGWAHFLMAYRYGTDKQGVPFVRYEDFVNGYDNSIPPQQASVIDNYKLIIEDMENAKKRLPRFEDYDDKDLGRAHQAAAIAFQVKVYAYWAMWDETKWDEVIKLVDELETTYNRGWQTLSMNCSLLTSQNIGERNIYGLFQVRVVLLEEVLNFRVLYLKIKVGASTMVGDKLNRHMTFMRKC